MVQSTWQQRKVMNRKALFKEVEEGQVELMEKTCLNGYSKKNIFCSP